MIKLVKEIENAKFVTHSGKFHADEIFGTVLLEKIYGDIELIRVSEIDGLNLEHKLVYDIGGGKFDHHQKGGNGEREATGIRYAAFGLLWQELGRKFLKQIADKKDDDFIELCFEKLDKNFVQFIDAFDNGQTSFEDFDYKIVTISDMIEGFNPNWNEDVDSDVKFMKAYEIAKVIFDNKIESTIAKCMAKDLVEEAIEKSENGILVLDKFMPYQEFVLESKNPKAQGILYAVFESNRSGYTVRAIQKQPGSFENRKSFPKEWAGLRNEDLQRATGVKTATFCHNACFICVALDFEDAMKLAKLAVES